MVKRFVIFGMTAIIAFLCASAVYVVIASNAGRGRFFSDDWMPYSWRFKQLAAAECESPRILLLAGSGTMFGCDSEELERLLARPVVNLAMQASVPIGFYPELLDGLVREGDTIVLPLEFAHYSRAESGTFTDLPISMLLGCFPQCRASLTFGQSVKLYSRYALSWIQKCSHPGGITYRQDDARLMARWKSEHPVERKTEHKYDYLMLNRHGDMLVDEFVDGPISPDPLPTEINAYFLESFARLRAFAERRGLRLIVTWPNMRRYIDSNAYEVFRGQLRECGIELMGFPPAFSFPDACYYDTVYHLNAGGARLNARALAKTLAPLMGVEIPEVSSWPHVVFAESPRSGFPTAREMSCSGFGVTIGDSSYELLVRIPEALHGKTVWASLIVDGTEEPPSFAADAQTLSLSRKTGAAKTELLLTLMPELTASGEVRLTVASSGVPTTYERLTLVEEVVQPIRYLKGFCTAEARGRWTEGEECVFRMRLDPKRGTKDLVLEFEAGFQDEVGGLWCGETCLKSFVGDWSDHTFTLPLTEELVRKEKRMYLQSEELEFRLQLKGVKSPRERGWSTDERKLALMVRRIELK